MSPGIPRTRYAAEATRGLQLPPPLERGEALGCERISIVNEAAPVGPRYRQGWPLLDRVLRPERYRCESS